MAVSRHGRVLLFAKRFGSEGRTVLAARFLPAQCWLGFFLQAGRPGSALNRAGRESLRRRVYSTRPYTNIVIVVNAGGLLWISADLSL